MSLPVETTSLATYGEGGTKKSPLLVAMPAGVDTLIRPDVPLVGTVVAALVVVAEETMAPPRPLNIDLDFKF